MIKAILNYKRFDKGLPALLRTNDRNAGFDLFARTGEEGILIKPGEDVLIPLNVATEIPSYAVGLLFQRSSTYKTWGVKLTNGVGVVDSLYSGDGDEWKASFKNETDKPVVISNGDKICQAVFLSLLPVKPEEKDVLGNADRGGFGTSFNNAEDLNKG